MNCTGFIGKNRKGVWNVFIVTLNTYWKVYNYILNNLSEKSQISKYKTDKVLHPYINSDS